MKKLVIPIWKPVGWTPLESILEFKKNNPEYDVVKISYAGRLDPMAEGILLLLIGEENKKRKEYEKLNKKYESEIILGISTDSFDALGIIYNIKLSLPAKDDVDKCLRAFVGRQDQTYPPYSSKPVKGRPLFWWAKNNRLSEIKIPKKKIEITSIKLESIKKINATKLFKDAEKRIKKVKGDFRQAKILEIWEKFADKHKHQEFLKIRILVTCLSGVYIRRLASDIGEKLGTGGFALSITRTSVGNYTLNDTMDIRR